MKPTPPKTPPPRHMIEPQFQKATADAKFQARLLEFKRDMQLDDEDMKLLHKLNQEVADLIMSEPPLLDSWQTRERCRERIRDSKMYDLLVQIKDLEDDCELDVQTRERLRKLPRNAIEGILQHDRHWTPETQRQQIQQMVQHLEKVIEACDSSKSMTAEKVAKALVTATKTKTVGAQEAEKVIPRAKKASQADVEQISSEEESLPKKDSAGTKRSNGSNGSTAEEATSGAKASKKDKEVKQAVAPNFQVPQTPLMRQVEGMIKAHHHSDAFLKETTDYVKRFTLHTEFTCILQMLNSTVASGVMRACRDTNQIKNEQDIILQVQLVNPLAGELGQQLLRENYFRWTYSYPGGYPGYWGWRQLAAKAKKSKKEKKDKKSKKKEKRRSKGSKRKDSSYTYTEDESSPSPRRLAAARKAFGAAERRRGTPQEPTTESMQERFKALLRDEEPQGPSSSPKRARHSTAQVEPKDPKMSRENELELKQWLESLDGKGNLLEYLPTIKEKYASLREMAEAAKKKEVQSEVSALSSIEPEFWKECSIGPLGHRLLFAKKIVAM